MAAIRVEQFAGTIPRFSNRLLPPNNAEDARNARLLSGELRGLAQPEFLHEFTGPTVKTVYHARDSSSVDVWMGFTNLDVDVVRGPVVEDAFDRYYYTGEEAFVAYNELSEIALGNPPFRLGTPRPLTGAVLTPPGGGTPETRAYVYTFVNQFGEEGAPSPPLTGTGNAAGTWALTSIPTTGPDMTNRKPLAFINIYRTVTGTASAEFYFVAQITIGTVLYNDTTLSVNVVRNDVLQADGYEVPPDNLLGLIAHPNGFLVGFVGKELHFSLPFRPHAWDSTLVVAIEHKIVGLAVYQNSIAVMTVSQPYFAAGSDPHQISLIKSPSVEPCQSKGGIAQTVLGVLYPSSNGLVLFNESGPQVITYPILSKDEWSTYNTPTLRGAQFAMRYIGFTDDTNGFVYAPSEPLGTFFTLDRFSGIQNIQTDVLSGDVVIVKDNRVYKWEPADGMPLYYTWKSKVFDVPKPLNFSCVIVKSTPAQIVVSQATIDTAIEFNLERMAFKLNPLGRVVLGGSRTEVLAGDPFDPVEPGDLIGIRQDRFPVGGSPLFNIVRLSGLEESAVLNVYADGTLRASLNVTPNLVQRLPSGFKAHTWQLELLGNLRVYSMAMATTARELSQV